MNHQSARLLYREFTETDFQRFYSVFSNERVMRYALMDPFRSAEEIRPYFA
ncbi:hypothetical protein EDC14_1003126 [Hydrogenispora ethanolica]|jgi:ribosomal-protein-alanine N-acetyltransferase|uniref:Acetyltransferase (GNAT) family protein n=1 Tax=Hydrogenispora ethanolica TaxID=1082276 RepID=A0A4R1S7X0_HYDET|nr:hypothetical protein [Hydrogenispora ethanolica]TCL75194.1 hypothetical protein EDC14_1003126 [Hydrogenispora ethanolica]